MVSVLGDPAVHFKWWTLYDVDCSLISPLGSEFAQDLSGPWVNRPFTLSQSSMFSLWPWTNYFSASPGFELPIDLVWLDVFSLSLDTASVLSSPADLTRLHCSSGLALTSHHLAMPGPGQHWAGLPPLEPATNTSGAQSEVSLGPWHGTVCCFHLFSS